MADVVIKIIIKDDGTAVLKRIARGFDEVGKAASKASKYAETEAKKASKSIEAETKRAAKEREKADKQAAQESAKAAKKAAKEAEKAAKDRARAEKKAAAEAAKPSPIVANLEKAFARLNRTVIAFMGLWAFREITQGLKALVDIGFTFNATIEQSKLGMSSLLIAQGQFVTSSGKALAGTESLNAAMSMSDRIAKQLMMDNLKTAATYEQLVRAYQQTLAPGLEVGFDPDEIRNFTVAMVQAASAMGMNLDMLGEETRSMLRGTITPRTTLIASALGLRNEDIAKYKGDAEGLYSFLMGRLQAFGVAGEASQRTWAGITSNIRDAFAMVLGEGMRPAFEYYKREILNLQTTMVSWNPENVAIGPALDEGAVKAATGFGEALIWCGEALKVIWDLLKYLGPLLDTIWQAVKVVWEFLVLAYQVLKPVLMVVKLVVVAINEVISALARILELVANILHGVSYLVERGFSLLVGIIDDIGKSLGHVLESAFDFLDVFIKILEVAQAIGRFIGLIPTPKLAAEAAVPEVPETTYMANEPKLTKDQQNELLKVRTTIGLITEDEKARINAMLEQMNLHKSINDLTSQEAVKLVEIQREMEESTLPLKDRVVYLEKAARELAILDNAQKMNLNSINSQIAQQNKNYSEQVDLIEEAVELEIQKLRLESKSSKEMEDALRKQADLRADIVKQQRMSEVLGYKERIVAAQAAMAGLTGEYEKQLDLETRLLDLTLKRQKLTGELRKGILPKFDPGFFGDMGNYFVNLVEDIGNKLPFGLFEKMVGGMAETVEKTERARNELEKKIKLQQREVELQSQFLDLLKQSAGVYGDFISQAKYMRIENEIAKKNLELSGKYSSGQLKILSSKMDQVANERVHEALLSGIVDLNSQRLDQEEKIASASGSMEGVLKAQKDMLLQQVSLMHLRAMNVRKEQPGLANQLDLAANLLFMSGIAGQTRDVAEATISAQEKMAGLRSTLGGLAGSYKIQAGAILETNRAQVASLALDDKILAADKPRLASMMNLIAQYQAEDVILQGRADILKKQIDLQLQLAQSTGNVEEALRLQRAALEIDVGLLEVTAKRMEELGDPKSAEAVRNIVKLMRDWAGVSDEIVRSEFSSRLISMRGDIARLTGSVDEYVKSLRDANREAIKFKSPAEAALMTTKTELEIKQYLFDVKAKGLGYKRDVAELSGSWKGVLGVEQELLLLEYRRALAIEGLSEEAKDYLEIVTQIKLEQLEAAKNLNAPKLIDLGLQKAALETSQELANMYGTMLPDALDTFTNSASNLFVDLTDSTKKSKDVWQDFANTVSQSLIKMITDLGMMIVKMELLKAMGYGEGFSFKGWFSKMAPPPTVQEAGTGTAAIEEAVTAFGPMATTATSTTTALGALSTTTGTATTALGTLAGAATTASTALSSIQAAGAAGAGAGAAGGVPGGAAVAGGAGEAAEATAEGTGFFSKINKYMDSFIGAIEGAFSKLWGVLSKIGISIGKVIMSIVDSIVSILGLFHSGGIVQAHKGMPNISRNKLTAMYENASLRQDEVLARLQTGEAVINRNQVRRFPSLVEFLLSKYHSGGMVGTGANQPTIPYPIGTPVARPTPAPEVHVNLINQSGEPLRAKQGRSKTEDNKIMTDLILERVYNDSGYRQGWKTGMGVK